MISVIIPLYKGGKYVNHIINQIQSAKMQCINQEIELVFVNDYPEESIEIPKDEYIRLVQNPVNCGIHGARVEGLLKSKGDFVVFMDQDDEMSPLFFQSQLEKIGDADAVVCNVIHEERKYYTDKKEMIERLTLSNISRRENCIITPGQVLIRKKAIPHIWMEKKLSNNGADDWMLWLCMLTEQKTFAVNDQILFEHVVHNSNTSRQGASMFASIQEVSDIICDTSDYPNEIKQNTIYFVNHYRNAFIAERDYYMEMSGLLCKWIGMKNNNQAPYRYLIKRHFFKVAIYGMGMVGQMLADELKSHDIAVEFFIDKKGPDLRNPYILLPEQIGEIQIPIIVSVVSNRGEEIVHKLKKKTTVPIIRLEDLLDG